MHAMQISIYIFFCWPQTKRDQRFQKSSSRYVFLFVKQAQAEDY